MTAFVPPKTPSTLISIACALVAHSMSNHIFKAALLITLDVKYQVKPTTLKTVTYAFEMGLYGFLVFGAILCEIVKEKMIFVVVLICASVIVNIIFYLAYAHFLVKAAVILIAAFYSTIKIGMIGFGAAEYYNTHKCTDIYKYLLVTYLTETVGQLGALIFMPRHIWSSSQCGIFSCITYAMILTILFEIIAGILFGGCNSNDASRPSGFKILLDIPSLNRLLIIFIPLIVIWICHETIIRELSSLARLMNRELFWYPFNYENMMYKNHVIIILFGIVYFFTIYMNRPLQNPITTIGLGGLLITFAVFIGAYLNFYTIKYRLEIPSANNAKLYFVTSCGDNCTFTMNSFNIKLNGSILYRRDWDLSGKNNCNTATLSSTSTTQVMHDFSTSVCLMHKRFYLLTVKCLSSPFEGNFDLRINDFHMRRDRLGRPILCVAAADGQWGLNYHIKFQETSHLEARYIFMANDNFTCKPVKEGYYNVVVNYTMDKSYVFLQYGGIYLMKTTQANYTLQIIQKPTGTPIAYLLILIILVQFGTHVIATTGLYIAYSQTEPTVRTIAIGCYYLYMSTGYFVSYISDRLQDYLNSSTLVFNAVVVGFMTIIFVIISKNCGRWIIICGPALTEVENARHRRIHPQIEAIQLDTVSLTTDPAESEPKASISAVNEPRALILVATERRSSISPVNKPRASILVATERRSSISPVTEPRPKKDVVTVAFKRYDTKK